MMEIDSGDLQLSMLILGISNCRKKKYHDISHLLSKHAKLGIDCVTGQPKISGDYTTVSTTNVENSSIWVVSLDGYPVGIDAESSGKHCLLDSKYAKAIATRFTEGENTILKSVPARHRIYTFMVLWTRKEAIAKSFGESIIRHLATPVAETGISPVYVAMIKEQLVAVISGRAGSYIVSIAIHLKIGGYMDKKIVEDKIKELIEDYLEATDQRCDNINNNSKLIGSNAILKSIGLVAVIVDIESWLADEGFNVRLTSEKAMSTKYSPFRTLESLADFIVQETK